ncbi:hypothetical protein CYY_003999 [Polysphondylium violaceum]|uniref:Uncharacterized protein n=1 Tax=Polysphondylium violaceum TaxID=133409 RepID=A0A8J4UZN5_9MYCE|nr:hypothetical protein CYY_003999 [Polysphondylium violaceum]
MNDRNGNNNHNDCSVNDILDEIKSKKNISEAKSLCLVASSLFKSNHYLLLQHYIISIKERDFKTSNRLFWDIFNNEFFSDYIVYIVLLSLVHDIKSSFYYLYTERNYPSQFSEIFVNSNNNSNSSNNSNKNNGGFVFSEITLYNIIESIYKNLNQDKRLKDYINEIDQCKYYNPIKILFNGEQPQQQQQQQQQTEKEKIGDLFKFMNLLNHTCKYLNQHQHYEYSTLLYLLFKFKFNNLFLSNNHDNDKEKHNILLNNQQFKSFWFNGLNTFLLYKKKFKIDKNSELILLPINVFSMPLIFHMDKEEFKGKEFKRFKIIKYCWKYYVCKGDDISYELVMKIQDFLQLLADSGTPHFKKSSPRLVIDLLSDPEKSRHDYFERNSNEDDDDDETVDSNEAYEFEIHLGIYLLSSLFYVSAWRYFRFLVLGNPNITPNAKRISNPKTCIITSVNNKDIGIPPPKLSMIVRQVLNYYSSVSSYDDDDQEEQDKKNAKTNQKAPHSVLETTGINHLTLTLECYNDLNQEPWIEDFKKLFTKLWSQPRFYWLKNSIADGHYFYESYSMGLSLYKEMKTQLSGYHSKTLIPIAEIGKKLSFDPKDDLWINRLFLNLGLTNHSEIEDAMIFLLEILVSISIPENPKESTRIISTLKPYFTSFNEEEILFWCIVTLATFYERLGMVGEMIVLYQLYWSYFKPRFQQVVNTIKYSSDVKKKPKLKEGEIPLSNLAIKDLQIGFFFPRFFDYIINIEMLEEFSCLLTKGFKLDILQSDQVVENNRDMISIIERHITTSTRKPDMTLPVLLNKFFADELDNALSKREQKNKDKEMNDKDSLNGDNDDIDGGDDVDDDKMKE